MGADAAGLDRVVGCAVLAVPAGALSASSPDTTAIDRLTTGPIQPPRAGTEATGGYLCGYRFDTDGVARALDWTDIEAGHLPEHGLVWVHFRLADASSRAWLMAQQRVPEGVRDILVEPEGRPRLRVMGEGVVGLIADFEHEMSSSPRGTVGMLRFWLDRTCFITSRAHPLMSADALRHEIEEGWRCTSSSRLLCRLIELLAEGIADHGQLLTERLDTLEDTVLAGSLPADRNELGSVRRLVAGLRRQIGPERFALTQISNGRLAWLTGDELNALRHAAEELGASVQLLESINERAKMLQEEVAARVAEDTNRNVLLLSIMTAVLLPATLITGVFGMNVAGLPGLGDPTAFAWVMGVMIVVAAGTLIALKRWRLF